MKIKVLLSYSTPDLDTVRKLRDALRRADIEAWIAADEILVGESIPQAVARLLNRADFVVPCLSKAAAASGWVKAELDLAIMHQFGNDTSRVLPVRLEDVDAPGIIAHLKYVDLFPDPLTFQEGVATLVRSIKELKLGAESP
ncbi:MAG: toll/interleukin-1 receptor domain-containing protein [Polyangiaceae bacterium]|nr:toll/interleukin-1 receptor domain-containing protein [Polyangiaceae bacterium]